MSQVSWQWWTLVGQAAVTWFLVGLIWFVQVVHYPLMAQVGRGEFRGYELVHTRRTTWVVVVPMVVELVTAAVLVAWRPFHVPAASAWLGLGLVLVIWLSTFWLQVPEHERLAAGFDEAAHARLVAYNWVRTVAWSLRGVLVGYLLVNGTVPR